MKKIIAAAGLLLIFALGLTGCDLLFNHSVTYEVTFLSGPVDITIEDENGDIVHYKDESSSPWSYSFQVDRNVDFLVYVSATDQNTIDWVTVKIIVDGIVLDQDNQTNNLTATASGVI